MEETNVCRGITGEVQKDAAEELFVEELRKALCMNNDIYNYELSKQDDSEPENSYSWLLSRVEAQLQKRWRQPNLELVEFILHADHGHGHGLDKAN